MKFYLINYKQMGRKIWIFISLTTYWMLELWTYVYKNSSLYLLIKVKFWGPKTSYRSFAHTLISANFLSKQKEPRN